MRALLATVINPISFKKHPFGVELRMHLNAQVCHCHQVRCNGRSVTTLKKIVDTMRLF